MPPSTRGGWEDVSMRSARAGSARLLFDLQACQTKGSGLRGVGRYSQALFSALAPIREDAELWTLISPRLPLAANLDAVAPSRVLRLPEPPNWNSPRNHQGGEFDALDAAAYAAFIGSLNADVVHVSHVFEGYGDRVALPAIGQRAAGQVMSTTLYDLIPLLFEEHYFQDSNFRRWYLARLAWLRQADLLLAISESSRQDAIDLLGIEPWRVVTIGGSVSENFQHVEGHATQRRELLNRYQLRGRFVLYTGGDDHRKNIRGAVAGFAAVDPQLRRDCQLVIVCAMSDDRKQMYLDIAKSEGLAPGDVLITGFVSEQDLIALYRACDVFVFPSLYEGLGLPVLEAMACGAPALGGDNSSVRELIERPDALFDAGSPRSIGDAIGRVLADAGFAADLRRYGLSRSREFSWQKSAGLAAAAFDDAIERARHSGAPSAVQGWLPRKRLAIFTPLPPSRSGIADFNAKFLPFLARHFDIDLYVDGYRVEDDNLTAAFRIFDAKDFDGAAHAYDGILYEFGNSEFHAHMLPLLDKYPGIVGLHDAYLSGLFGYLEFQLGEAGRYAREMLDAHGPQARRLLAPAAENPDPIGAAVVELPCTKWVLDRAIGVISHSPFNLQVARSFYPQGWRAPYRIIAQMVQRPRLSSASERQRLRSELGFEADDVVIATFGHIAWTKWGDRLLQGFLQSSLSGNRQAYLVFAGEIAKDDFGSRLKSSIRRAGLGDRIRITGYLSESDYEKYLRIVDLAVQLRTKSRGGTPKGVLDCMAHRVAVMVNNDASYVDYPDDAVIKLSSEPSVDEIAGRLDELSAVPASRARYAQAGRRYVEEHHDPAQCAAEYAGAIHAFLDRGRRVTRGFHVSAFATHLAGTDNPGLAVEPAAQWIEHAPVLRFQRRRLLIDVSHIAQSDHQTGVPRVVTQIVKALYLSRRPGIEPVAVQLVDGALQVATAWLTTQRLLLPHEIDMQATDVQIASGDVLMMLDSSWARYREFYPVFERARRVHAPIYTAIYDLLPVTLPPGNIVDGGREWFESWFRDAADASDGLVCISSAVAKDVADYLGRHDLARPGLKVGFWHLGADFAAPQAHTAMRPEIAALQSRPYLLMVGTIDPRKSHADALAAMEILWAQDLDLGLCIAGKEGWMVGELLKRLRNHPASGRRLFFVEHPSDAEIDFLYRQAAGLLMLSKGEGFGLPLVEAAHHGIPIVCSNLPVFREIAGEFATYVEAGDAQALAAQLAQWWQRRFDGQLPTTHDMPRLTWGQSAEALLDVIIDNNWIKD